MNPFRRLILILGLLLPCLLPARAQQPDSLRVSLVTCWPGREVYELCGHSAIRISSERFDSVWNYGLFNFAEPNFIYRFAAGETDYMVGGYPFAWFLEEYRSGRRRVVEQRLRLTQEQAARLRRMLQEESLPQNRTYHYNYVRDNCVTRILERLDSVAGPVTYPDTVRYGSFRREMRAWHRNYPWYQLGIDLALGSGLDADISGREEMFVPLDAMERMEHAKLPDGTPLADETIVLNEGSPDATDAPTPWWLTPLFWSCVVSAALIGVAVYDLRRRRISRFVYFLFFLALGIAGCAVSFLVFISSHEATSPNMMLVWLNPLCLLVPALIYVRPMRGVTAGFIWFNLVAVAAMLLIWPFQQQNANPALFPLMAADAVLSAAYAIISVKNCYKDNGTRPQHRGTRKAAPKSRRKK